MLVSCVKMGVESDLNAKSHFRRKDVHYICIIYETGCWPDFLFHRDVWHKVNL